MNGLVTTGQVEKLKNNPDVLNVWPDQVLQMDTANTPKFLGLTAPIWVTHIWH